MATATYGYVAESISPRTVINSLDRSLAADHVAVFRPTVTDADRIAAITDAFGHIGKPYDFEFDFNVTTRIVCTELVYRGYHNRAPPALS